MSKKGSGVLTVIVLTMVLVVYVTSTYTKVENYSIIKDKYSSLIEDLYEYEELEDIYDKIIN